MLVNKITAEKLKLFVGHPSHGLIIYGSGGSGKERLAAQLLEDLGKSQQTLKLTSEQGKAIGIDKVRSSIDFLKIKNGQRALLINEAETLTEESQNALLKTLEEPSEGSIIVLVTASFDQLLPTIRSRADSIEVLPIDGNEAKKAFPGAGLEQINKSMLLSDGAAELFEALMSGEEHPLREQIETAKNFLKAPAFEKLTQAEKLKESADTLVDSLLRIARSTLKNKQLNDVGRRRWIKVYELSAEASEQLKANVSKKSVLLNLALGLK